MPQYKLIYFDIRGLGETTRMIFAQAGVEYTDERIAREDWQKRKAGIDIRIYFDLTEK